MPRGGSKGGSRGERSAIADKGSQRNATAEDIFTEYDQNGNGNINKTELKACLAGLLESEKMTMSEGQIRQFVNENFSKFDKDGSGEMSYDEFVNWYNEFIDWSKAHHKTEIRGMTPAEYNQALDHDLNNYGIPGEGTPAYHTNPSTLSGYTHKFGARPPSYVNASAQVFGEDGDWQVYLEWMVESSKAGDPNPYGDDVRRWHSKSGCFDKCMIVSREAPNIVLAAHPYFIAPRKWTEASGNPIDEWDQLAQPWDKHQGDLEILGNSFNVKSKQRDHILGELGCGAVLIREFNRFWVVLHGIKKDKAKAKDFANAPFDSTNELFEASLKAFAAIEEREGDICSDFAESRPFTKQEVAQLRADRDRRGTINPFD